ncbi:MAG: response regulator [Aggregatilineales bacterium]
MSKILVIEDADALRNDIIEMLTFEGFSVEGVENGLLGVEAAQSYHPDLIICDIMMPELNGYQVLESLQKDSSTRTIPFIFLTARTDRSDMRYGMGLGADDYLLKPFMATELLETINARLRRHETFVEIAEQQVQDLSENIMTALPHELRTPLNTILGFSEMLSLESARLKPNEVARWAQHINEAGRRLNRLIENYLMFARVETLHRDAEKLTELRNHETLAGPIIQMQAYSKVDLYDRADDLRMTVDDEPYVAVSDQDLSKIIEEILDNALKFSNEGTPLNVVAAREDDRYVLRVKNAGRGMTQPEIDAIGAYMQFNRYFYEQQGNGLGLIISKRLVELYGGEFKICSDVDRETEIVIKLPLSDHA